MSADPALQLAAPDCGTPATSDYFLYFHIRLQIPMLDLTIHPSKKPEDF